MSNPTPTRHGNWHMVDGQLVDLDATPPPAAKPVATTPDTDDAAPAQPPAGEPAEGSTRRRKSTKE